MNMLRTVKAPVPYQRYTPASGPTEKDLVAWKVRNGGDSPVTVKLAVSKINRPVSPTPSASFAGDAVVFVIEEFIGYGTGEDNQEMSFRHIPKLQDASNTGDWLKVYCNGDLLEYGTDYLVSVEDKRLNFDTYVVEEGALITADYRYDDPLETSYKYRVVAFDEYGEAAPSEAVEVMGPLNLGDGNAITVTWEVSAYATGYWLYRRIDQGSWEVMDCDIDDLSVVDSSPMWETAQGLPYIDDAGVIVSLMDETIPRHTMLDSEGDKAFLEPTQELAFWSDDAEAELIITGAGV